MDTTHGRRGLAAGQIHFLSGSYSPAREVARALGGRLFWEPVSNTIRTVPHGYLIARRGQDSRWDMAADPEIYRLAPQVSPEQLARLGSRFLGSYPTLLVAMLSELLAPGLEPLRQSVWARTPAGFRQEGPAGLRWVLYLDPLTHRPELTPLASLGRARLLNLLEGPERAVFELLGLPSPTTGERCPICGGLVLEAWSTGQPMCEAGHGPFRTPGVET